MSENSSSSDFLYIILTIILAIIGLLRKSSSKQKQTARRQIAEEEQPSEWETPPFSQDKIVADYSDPIEDEYFSNYNFIEEAEQKEEEFGIQEEQENNIPEPGETEESIDFDARTAFIYSEILTRKYN